MPQFSTGTGKLKPALGATSHIFSRSCFGDPSQDTKFTRHRLACAKNLYRKDLHGHFGCVNAIEFSNHGGEYILSGGDDRRVLLWNTEKALNEAGKPDAMKGQHHSNIFCLAFDNSNSKIFSGGNDEQVIVHDVESGSTTDVFLHQDAVYGLSVDPLNDNVFASACDDGRILIYDTRAPASEDPFCLANYLGPMHAVMYNPVEPRLLATANAKEGLGLWDVRKPRTCLMRYGGSLSAQSCMSVRISRDGERLIALRRKLPPIMYNIKSSVPMFMFDHAGYFNSCTMKSCCFAGDKDQYILSGSDDFNLYMWRIPDYPLEVPWVGEAHMVLRGHRSIVNQVRCNPSSQLVLSSGVEKVIKAWSPFPLPRSVGDLDTDNNYIQRLNYTHEEYINLVLQGGQMMTHDYTQQSTDEDPRMLAFFDSLVQRELEGWSTDDDAAESESNALSRFVVPSPSSSSNSDDGDFNSPFSIAFASIMASRWRDNDSDEMSETEAAQRGESQTEAAPSSSQSSNAREPTHSRSTATERLPGQRLNASRQSISNLIAQKRTEYLANIRKLERRVKKHRAREKNLQSKAKLRLRVVSSTNESPSSSSGATKTKKLRVSTCVSSSSSSSSSSHSRSSSSSSVSSTSSSSDTDSDQGGEAISKLRAERRKRIVDLGRLKRLRSRILDSDSHSSSEDNKKTCTGTSRTNVMDDSQVASTSSSSSSSSVQNSEAVASTTSSCDNCNSSDAQQSRETHTSNNGSLNGRPSAQSDISSSKAVEINGYDTGQTNNGDSSEQMATTTNCTESVLNNNETVHVSDTVNNSATISADSTNGNWDSSDTSRETSTWREFSRFKHRLERARRHYRRRNQAAENNVEDDEDTVDDNENVQD